MSFLIYPHVFLFQNLRQPEYHLKNPIIENKVEDNIEIYTSILSFSEDSCTISIGACSDNEKLTTDNINIIREFKKKVKQYQSQAEESIKGNNTEKDSNTDKKKYIEFGRSWVITGYLDISSISPMQNNEIGNTNIDYQSTIVQKIYKDFTQEEAPINFDKTQFINTGVFAFNFREPQKDDILIVIFPSKNVQQSAINSRIHLEKILLYKHKIEWAYINAQTVRDDLHKVVFSIETNAESDLKIQDISNLDNEISILDKKIDGLVNNLHRNRKNYIKLGMQYNTLNANFHNYNERIEQIYKEIKSHGLILVNNKEKLKLLSEYSKFASKKYLTQVKSDMNFFKTILEIYENDIFLNSQKIANLRNAIANRRNAIANRKATQDRHFEDFIAVIGVGIGSASLAATAFSPYSAQQCSKNDNNLEPIEVFIAELICVNWIWIFLYIAIGGFFGFVTHVWRNKSSD